MQGASARPVCPRRITLVAKTARHANLFRLPLWKTGSSLAFRKLKRLKEMSDLAASLLGVINGYFG